MFQRPVLDNLAEHEVQSFVQFNHFYLPANILVVVFKDVSFLIKYV